MDAHSALSTKIEWVKLKEYQHEAFAEAMALEKSAVDSVSPFTWSEGESLLELAKPDRVAQIEDEFEQKKQKALKCINTNPLRPNKNLSIDDVYYKLKFV